MLALATAGRFYFVSMLGQRVVADVRADVHDNMLRLEPRFFEENRPSEIASRITADTTVIETVVGSTVSIALRNMVMGIGGVIYLFTLAPMLTLGLLLGIPCDHRADRAARPPRPQPVAPQPGPGRRGRHDRRRDAGRDAHRPGVSQERREAAASASRSKPPSPRRGGG